MHRLALVCLVLAAFFLAVSRADAGQRICKHTYVGSHERQRVQEAMQAVLPPGVSAKDVTSISDCRSQLSAWLETVPRLRSDGVTEWWIVTCDRERRKWICDSPTHRQLIWVFAQVDGVFRRLEVTYADAISLARARRVSVQAINILQDPASLPVSACGTNPGTDTRAEWEKARKNFPVQQADTVIEMSLDIWETRTSTVNAHINGEDGMTLMFTEDSTWSPSEGSCWEQWIIVG